MLVVGWRMATSDNIISVVVCRQRMAAYRVVVIDFLRSGKKYCSDLTEELFEFFMRALLQEPPTTLKQQQDLLPSLPLEIVGSEERGDILGERVIEEKPNDFICNTE